MSGRTYTSLLKDNLCDHGTFDLITALEWLHSSHRNVDRRRLVSLALVTALVRIYFSVQHSLGHETSSRATH